MREDGTHKEKTAFFAYSDAGCLLAKRLRDLLQMEESEIHTTGKFAEKYRLTPHESICRDMEGIFAECSALIFVCSCGIAVRAIAPYVKSKTTDPAVLVMDDMGRFVIPILSGHIGGANALAVKIAELTGAVLAATTATDIRGRFSVDAWGAQNGFHISSLEDAKAFSAAILQRELPVRSEVPLPEKLPEGLYAGGIGEDKAIGLYIGIHINEPYAATVRLVPEAVTLGIGCRKGTGAGEIRNAVSAVLRESRIDIHSVCRIATIDVKKEEAGLQEFAQGLGAEVRIFTAEELDRAEGEFEESEFVKSVVGVGNVCERAAALCGRIVVKKTKCRSVTVAVSVQDWEVKF